ncbi:putative abc transporter atp-binding protein [Stappia aggregata IAM 12614]|uniref:Putative abc transporter atp-binding protein n=1 Tax=Roseibium aggregatum (strain ATCC 25650 / DSM 13394 / JCM 20685 / NBRC 16684 / NCIMB 2208 / IAM 12614 / B1) TaxID=384765 RepID=A0P3U3_ROSAI|nr:ABC transporter ATP-binding protein [Roseibium aggregatum]EAV40287.1 putative abc transporter atp-binding protein [Stappia aggregata IAM 12614] [Roseibium aggregatum IAM 12614]
MSHIKLKNLVKRFKDTEVLSGIDLDVPEGSTLVLFGPSGAGKTVLLRCIAGAVEQDDGEVRIGGEDVTDVLPEHRGIGMAFQNFALFPHMDAFDNIASPLTACGKTADQIRAGVDTVARLLKIDHVLTHTPKALSNGQKQRTALARALVSHPKVLLLDDPLRNVDAKLRFEMRLELPRLLADQGATVIYVTQDYREAMALGDRIAVLDGGRIIQNGTPEEIYRRPATINIAKLFGDPTINLLDVVPQSDASGVYATLSDCRIQLDPGLSGNVGRECMLGLRPEALSFTTANEGVPVTIEAETPFNEKAVTLVTTLRKREILVSRPAETPAPASGTAHITIDPRDAVLFDRQTGVRLDPNGTSHAAEKAA